MKKSKSFIAVILIFIFTSTNVLVFGQADARPAVKTDKQTPVPKKETVPPLAKKSGEKKPEVFEPVAIGGKSTTETEIKKKKFPWLIVGGIVVAGVAAAFLFLKKKDSTPKNMEPAMIRIPSGTFMMGSISNESFSNEWPVHQVAVSGFEIGKYEVTQAEWESGMGSNPSLGGKGSRLPVDSVSWNEVQTYIQKLNSVTGKSYRLPTEAEWEYACRAGTAEDRYGTTDLIAWCHGNSGLRPHEVGGLAPNSFGLYDMLGNVWEWCADWYGPYSAESGTNPKGPSSGNYRVIRGGSWFDIDPSARASRRDYFGGSATHLGFRLARD